MRTKTTLLCAAALAAGVVGSMAQSNVYSLNIVGYINTPVGAGNNLLANPFNLDGTNSAANVLTLTPLNDTYSQPSPTLNALYILQWNGRGFNSTYYENDYTVDNDGAGYAGWAIDSVPDAPATPPTLSPGVAFFLTETANPGTNTWVGSVMPLVGATNSISIGAGNNFVASMLPVSGPISNASFQFPVTPLNDTYSQPAGTLNALYLLTWNGRGYSSTYYENDYTVDNDGAGYAGWAVDSVPDAPAPPPTIGLAQGFIISETANPGTWSQTYPIP
jgi:hypothetical protein